MTDRKMTDRTIRLADLDASRPHKVTYTTDAQTCAEGAVQLGIIAVEKLRLSGKLTPKRKTDWQLTGRLGATVTQRCVVTLEPVKTRLEVELDRLFTADWTEPNADGEYEMSPDVNTEALTEALDLAMVAFEEVSLAMPDYPRATDAHLVETQAAPEGIEPLADEDLKPFAALKALRDKMQD